MPSQNIKQLKSTGITFSAINLSEGEEKEKEQE
jgi:hypothetical protein